MAWERLAQAAPCSGISLALRCMFWYFLCPVQRDWHKGGRRGKRDEIFMQMRQQSEVFDVLVKIGFDGALRVRGLDLISVSHHTHNF